jgi:hypothetical protein
MLFALREEAVKGQGVFADVRVDQQGDFAVKFAERRKGGKRHGDEISDTANVKDDLIGTFFEEPATEKSDHRKKVLPPFLRLSTRGRLFGTEGK